MRIVRGVRFRVTRLSKRVLVATASGTFFLAALTVGVLTLEQPNKAFAVTPPDTCFATSPVAGGVSITDYYDHESNNSANPACPRAVDIPATIGGAAVTAIAAGAFYDAQLSAFTLPPLCLHDRVLCFCV